MLVKFKYPLYENKTNAYCVYIYKDLERETNITCVGTSLPSNKSIHYEFTAEEVSHPKYGIQYKVTSYKEHIGTGKNNIVTYLSSGLIKGIGKATAEKIYQMFGDESLKILEEEPDRYLLIKGISKNKLDKIIKSYEMNHIPNTVIDFFTPFNISINHVYDFYKEYKRDLLDTVKENPYVLCRFRGITFKDVDPINTYLGLSNESLDRVCAAAYEIINTYMLSGMVGLTKELLLPGLVSYTCLSPILCWKKLVSLIHEERITYRKLCLHDKNIQYFYIPYVMKIEEELADMVVNMPKGIDESKEAMKLLDDISLFDQSQKEAIINSFSSNISIITGGPGTGKTTTVKEIVKIYKKLHSESSVYLMAPTGLAARRMSEAVGLPATTIHKGLRLDIHAEDNISEYTSDEVLIENALLIIDEFSMVDILLAHKIFKSLRNSKIILVGDIDQLPSIHCGNVLRDLINSGYVKTSRLKFVHRQSGNSTICENAHYIREGIDTIVEADDFHITYNNCNMAEMEQIIVDSYINAAKDTDIYDIMCLVPYKKYDAGVYALNNAIQERLNPLNDRKEVKGFNNMSFRVNDKVMHILSNTEDVVNGDIGRVVRVYEEDGSEYVDVKYTSLTGEDYIKPYEKSELKNLTLAYAMTIHKSQGSECKKVIMCITDFHKAMLKRKILYTGITRAKESVELFTTSKDLIKDIISNINEIDRNTLLSYLIKQKTDTFCTQESLSL